MSTPFFLPTSGPRNCLSFPWEGKDSSPSPPTSRSAASVWSRSLGTAAGDSVLQDHVASFPFLEAVKTPPLPRPKGEARSRGWERTRVEHCGSQDVKTHPQGSLMTKRYLGLLPPRLKKSPCQRGGDMPLGDGTPLTECAPRVFPVSHASKGSSTWFSRPAGAGELDRSSKVLAAGVSV